MRDGVDLPAAADPRDRTGRPLRVLVAEDNAANRCVLKALLQPFDIEVRLADDGCEAVAAANASAFDVLLMDANMPRMDGVEALRRIRREAGPCVAAPIYMLTADVFDDDVRRYIEAGADGVLGKPIEISQVFDVLSAVARKAA